ncbi:sigma-70 family RNA polymerase sigma factor [Pusillimonas sp. TS35]|uniref:sigma-70 family RNA polymerase sigma factor n=1 Tax=Paracandidimonas lactea TaxID=2895524 RepID=UPI00136D8FD0|nr:sigma-70 family RNA polymerase sigma factor [Paracandidimonas lactea]MYN12514.1 sigma-70 family RNA polymerase sigma factor [Pusillimonas sp. TS35]
MTASSVALPRQLETLYVDHAGWLRGWLRRRIGNAFDAEDIAHDTYMRILATGRMPAPADPRRHLALVANGLMIDLLRRRHIETAYLEAIAALPPAQVPSEEKRALIIEALVDIDRVLCGLPAKVRAAMLMCKLEGLGYRDIAQRLRVSVSSVEKYIAAGLVACHAAMSAK